MKKLFVLLSSVLLAGSLHAQHAAEYASATLDLVRTACSYILSTPLDKKDLERMQATQYLLRWMTGAPDYHFNIDETATKINDAKKDLLCVYLAAMTKWCLEHTDQKDNGTAVKLNTVRAVLAYCKEQGIKLKGELRKIADAESEGRLAEYLK
ncbi:MAG: hypothetical protein EOO11_20080 [Chitinophagaceae bacterium]|nr:MAG: hypothetical protein EOO11_20080 [Chitinophagaceae bacterium]